MLYYVFKLLGNTFFVRKEINTQIKDELNFLFQGLKHLVEDEDGNPLEDNFDNKVN